MTHPGQADPLLSSLADRIAERLVGIRKPYVSAASVTFYGDGTATVTLTTRDGDVAVTLARQEGSGT